jgi:hypothetical protein
LFFVEPQRSYEGLVKSTGEITPRGLGLILNPRLGVATPGTAREITTRM